jgi:hypothetical protein
MTHFYVMYVIIAAITFFVSAFVKAKLGPQKNPTTLVSFIVYDRGVLMMAVLLWPLFGITLMCWGIATVAVFFVERVFFPFHDWAVNLFTKKGEERNEDDVT